MDRFAEPKTGLPVDEEDREGADNAFSEEEVAGKMRGKRPQKEQEES